MNNKGGNSRKAASLKMFNISRTTDAEQENIPNPVNAFALVLSIENNWLLFRLSSQK